VGFQRVTQEVEELRGVSYEETQRLAAEVFAPGMILKVVQQ
jgi:hypothetical protein